VNILIDCDDVIGAAMAGTGIRCWEIGSRLAAAHEVTLATPYQADVAPAGFSVVTRPRFPPASYYRGYDAVITQRVLPRMAEAKRRYGYRLIVDLYDPALLENLEWLSGRPLGERNLLAERLRRDLLLALRTGDHFVCASETQRDMWLGALTAAGRITPSAYTADPTMRQLIDTVPFGVSDEPCARTGPGLRERFGIDGDDFVLLWGGGIWNWLDPLTLIESVAEVASTHPDTRLVFMGLEHPNERVPEMAMSIRAKKRAEDLDLINRHVFFNYGWLPYGDRCNFLLDADVGVSTHGDHVETHFAFRTRNLDYLWAALPILATRGDAFEDVIEKAGAGIPVPPNDSKALSEAIVSLRDPSLRARMSEASKSLAEQYSWARTIRPLVRMLDARSQVIRPSAFSVSYVTATWYALAAQGRLRGAGRASPGATDEGPVD
jgi:glycosyltransferase involved in cell wall biosynthesis